MRRSVHASKGTLNLSAWILRTANLHLHHRLAELDATESKLGDFLNSGICAPRPRVRQAAALWFRKSLEQLRLPQLETLLFSSSRLPPLGYGSPTGNLHLSGARSRVE
jgi:hypothetical protein